MQKWMIGILIAVIVLLSIIIGYANTHVYKCRKCGFVFKVLLPGKKLLQCPSCKHQEWAKEFRKNG
ncbi:MAG: hypothetical protein PHX21_01405 [bacterium]|nr:hypothetical protein [bacterium]